MRNQATVATLLVFLPFAILPALASASSVEPKVRRAEVTITLNLNAPQTAQEIRLWLPHPFSGNDQAVEDLRVDGNFSSRTFTREPEHGNEILYAEWRGPASTRTLTYTFRVTRREVVRKDLPPTETAFNPDEVARFLQPTSLSPLDGNIRATAEQIVMGRTTPAAKARAIYDWIIDNMRRDPEIKGCGLGDVERLLVNRRGKCGDIHSVFVALAKSVGVPAREVFGIRLPRGESGDITKAQHCWAEFYVPGYGWIPVDPADVRKTMLDKHLELGQEREPREYYFGAVDENRVAYGFGRDLLLDPPQQGGRINYFMYPYVEADGRPLDDLFGFNLGYTIAWRDVPETRPVDAALAAPSTEAAHASPASLNLGGNVLTFYGSLRLDAIRSDSRLNHPQFPMWVESEAAGSENNDMLDIHPRLTRFGLRLQRDALWHMPKATLAGNLEIDFQNRAIDEARGGSESRQMLRLRHAYFKLGLGAFSILAGQTWDLIAPLWPAVNADSLMWNSGNLGDRRPQVRVSYEPAVAGRAQLQIQFAVARTGAVDLKDLDQNGVRDGDDSGVPMVQGRIGVASLLQRLDVGVWAHHGWEQTQSVPNQPATDPPVPVTSARRSFTTTSVGADLKLTLGPLTVTGEAFWGRNLPDVRGGVGQGIGKTSGEEIEARGGWGQMRVAILSWLYAAAGATIDDVERTELIAGDRARNLALFGNLESDLGGGFLVGADYIHWRTTYVERPEGDANRFDLYAMVKF